MLTAPNEEKRMKEVEVICLTCPFACKIKLQIDDLGRIQDISGADCEKGKEYAIKEYKTPERILTATVRTSNKAHPLLSVRTNRTIPKNCLHQCMQVLAGVEVGFPVKIGETVVKNILDTGVDIVATQDLNG
jgi:CxxC motif-containing protein